MKRVIVFLFLIGSLAAAADLKVTIANNLVEHPPSAASNYDPFLSVEGGFAGQTIYLSGASQRIEFVGFPGGMLAQMESQPFGNAHLGAHDIALPHTAVITHCDTGIVDELNLDSHEYREFKMAPYPDEKTFLKFVDRAHNAVKNELQADTVDTGEKRVVFGQTARHLVTTVNEIRDAVHNPANGESRLLKTPVKEKVVTVIDGWYLDQPQPGCTPEFLRHNLAEAVTNHGLNLFGVRPAKNALEEPQVPKWQNYRAYTPGLLQDFGGVFPYGFHEVTLIDSPVEGITTRLVYTGYLPQGFAVEQQVTVTGTLPATREFPEEKRQGMPLAFKVTEFSDAALDPALFVVPPGFKKVKTLYPDK
jgi:hypothetical protein